MTHPIPNTKLIDNLNVETPLVLVLSEGKTEADRDNLRGHLFEKFVAFLLQQYGYEEPTTRHLNVTANGIELDVVTIHTLNKSRAIAECKAYTKNLSGKELTAFYGKVSAERLDDEHLNGFFVAIPGLTQPAEEYGRKICEKDRIFHIITSHDIITLLEKPKVLVPPPKADLLRSDFAVLVTSYGIYSAAKVLDPRSRLATSIHVWGSKEVPSLVHSLVEASDYAGGLPVSAISGQQPLLPSVSIPSEPTIVEVAGSKSELEYQFPASPKFFVGRRDHVKTFKSILKPGIDQGLVVVLNGQSGWGKSSLALQFKSIVMSNDGYAAVIDSRTASDAEFVWMALRKVLLMAEKHGIVQLPSDSSYASLNSTLTTIRKASWVSASRPLLIFFDQFENVFRDVRLTREFRNLAFGIREIQSPVIVGFAWKSDLVGMTDQFPYHLRDDITLGARMFFMEPLGPSEINTLLGRLERSAEVSLQKDLKQRLREVSQGLPWLFKKLASHVVMELTSGTSQEELVNESLNVKKLFENDLAELVDTERDALKKIARLAPRTATDIVELVPGVVVQSLLDRRLIVRVGDFFDTYWDIFRDFLITGEVVVTETFVLRQTPNAVAKLVREVIKSGGDLTIEEATERLEHGQGVIFNMSRDLKVLGVFTDRPRHVHISDDILAAGDKEAAIRDRVASALKKNKVFAVLKEMAEANEGKIQQATFVAALPRAFPAFKVSKKVWTQYARHFVNWLEYAELAAEFRGVIDLRPVELTGIEMLTTDKQKQRIRGGRRVGGQSRIFPASQPGPALQIIDAVAGQKPMPDMKPTTQQKALADLLILGILSSAKHNVYSLAIKPIDDKGRWQPQVLLRLIEELSGTREAVRLLRRKPTANNNEVGQVLQVAYEADWNEQTAQLMGKTFRAWARAAGLVTKKRRQQEGLLPFGESDGVASAH